MTTGILIGRFQPFHIEHLDIIQKLTGLYNVSKIVIVPIYYERNKREELSIENPIPLDYRVKYIYKVLSKRFPDKYLIIYPLKVSRNILNALTDFIYLLNMIRDEEYIIVTRDISKYFLFSFLKIYLMFLFNIKVTYFGERSIAASEIRIAIRDDRYEDIRKFLLEDLDRRAILYIKAFDNNEKKERNLDSILKTLSYLF